MMVHISNDSEYSGVFVSDGLVSDQAKFRYQARRNWILDRLDHPLLLVGPAHGPSGTYPWAHIYRTIFQDPYLLYLTGINQPGVALWLDPNTRDVTLFLPKKNPKLEFWEGTHFGSGPADAVAEVNRITGLSDVVNRNDIATHIRNRLEGRPLGLLWNTVKSRRKSDQTWLDILPIYRTLKRTIPSLTIQNHAATMWAQRLIMDEVDIANLRTANDLSADAYLGLLRGLSHCRTEQDAAALLEYGINSRSHFGASFPSIIAAGKNAAVLHYTRNNDPLAPNNLLLTDFGVRWHAMHADVTRVAPISGQYTPLQRRLIDITLDGQRAVESAAKPGVSIKELNDTCWDTIRNALDRQIIAKGGMVTLPYKQSPHNVSHFLGHQVHDGDPNREYRTRPLAAGNIISNEPGIYGSVSMTINGQHYSETLGIRIEDDLLITETGCANLTSCIKDPDMISATIRSGA